MQTYHNMRGEPEIADQYETEGARATQNLVIEGALGLTVRGTSKILLPIVQKRMYLAEAFLRKSGVPEIDRHMKAIHFDEQVYIKTLEPGTKLYRYSEVGQTTGKHYFSTETEFFPGQVGKMSVYDGKSVVIEEFTLTKRTKVLNSTVDLDGNKGATQVFSTEIQQNSTVREGSNWDELLNTTD